MLCEKLSWYPENSDHPVGRGGLLIMLNKNLIAIGLAYHSLTNFLIVALPSLVYTEIM